MTCHECGDGISKPAVTVHRGSANDLVFCSQFCHDDWSFERAVEQLKREAEQLSR